MKVIIAGGRDFNDEDFDDFDFLRDVMRHCIVCKHYDITEIVCGGAKGADSLGKRWAISKHVPVKLFPADWRLHGRSAGHIRNREMGDHADLLIAFWDGKSSGTRGMIDYMTKISKPLEVHRY